MQEADFTHYDIVEQLNEHITVKIYRNMCTPKKNTFFFIIKTESSLSPDWADTSQPPFAQLATPKYLPGTQL